MDIQRFNSTAVELGLSVSSVSDKESAIAEQVAFQLNQKATKEKKTPKDKLDSVRSFKYFNPKNLTEKGGGTRGKRPKWFDKNLADGITEEEMDMKNYPSLSPQKEVSVTSSLS